MEESSADIKWFNASATNSSKYQPEANHNNNNNNDESSQNVKFDPDSLYYDMTGDKFLIIFNHYLFKRTKYFKYQQPSTRTGTFEDVKRLVDVFGNLKFQVTVHQDLQHEDIINEVSKFCLMDHAKTSCVCVVILTHGDKGGELFAADRPYQFGDITSMFENGHYGLVSKPKLFIIQACRGGNMDAGKSVQFDGESKSVLQIPSHADFLVLHSSVEDHLSYRDANGSWMIQALCKVMDNHSEELDILHMITLVNKTIAYNKATYTPKCPETNNKKQMTETRFTLTKLFKFR